jgi:hypothetical protein
MSVPPALIFSLHQPVLVRHCSCNQFDQSFRCAAAVVQQVLRHALLLRNLQSVAGTLELYAISDLHTDYAANMEWVQQLDMTSRGSSSSSSSSSVLIVAGDVSDDIGILR